MYGNGVMTIFKGGLTNPSNIFNQGGSSWLFQTDTTLTNDAGVLNTRTVASAVIE